MLPLGVPAGPALVHWATTEITGRGEDHLSFRRLQDEDIVVLSPARPLLDGDDYRVERGDGLTTVRSTRPRRRTAEFEEFTLRFGPASE